MKQGKTSELEDTGSALGVKENSEYCDAAFPFEEGDLLLCCSDGLVETENAEGGPMRADVVTSLARADRKKSSDQLATGILNALEKHAGGKPTEDVTLIVMKN